MPNRLLLYLLVAASYCLLFTSSTDADLVDKKIISQNSFQASTLLFSKNNTANDSPVSSLFNISGFIPGGYSVNSFRVKNTGDSDLSLSMAVSSLTDNPLCHNLTLELFNQDQKKYSASLKDFNFTFTSIKSHSSADWMVMLKLSNVDIPTGQLCQFNFDVNSWVKDQPRDRGFRYQQIISNQVSSAL